VLRETTSRGLFGLVCPSRTSEHGGEGDCVKEGWGGEGKCDGEEKGSALLTASSCTACTAAGQYKSTTGSAVCIACQAGKFASTPGRSSCQNCNAGTYVSLTGSSVPVPSMSCKHISRGYRERRVHKGSLWSHVSRGQYFHYFSNVYYRLLCRWQNVSGNYVWSSWCR
jgi:hypothetical protein